MIAFTVWDQSGSWMVMCSECGLTILDSCPHFKVARSVLRTLLSLASRDRTYLCASCLEGERVGQLTVTPWVIIIPMQNKQESGPKQRNQTENEQSKTRNEKVVVNGVSEKRPALELKRGSIVTKRSTAWSHSQAASSEISCVQSSLST